MKNEKKLLALPFTEAENVIPPPDNMTYYGYIAEIVDDNILSVTVWKRNKDNSQSPMYRVFTAENDYMAQKKDEDGKWRRSTQKPRNLFGYYYYRITVLSLTEDTPEAVRKFLRLDSNTHEIMYFGKICEYVNNIGERRLKAKHDKIRSSINDVMLAVRDAPKDFEKWIDDVLYKEDRYIMYKYSRNKETEGYCTHCGKNVTVRQPRHRQRGICPNCGSEVTYIAQGKTTYFSKIKRGILLQRLNKQKKVVIRTFEVMWQFEQKYDSLRIETTKSVTEVYREFIGFGDFTPSKAYDWSYRDYEGRYDWNNSGYREDMYLDGMIYHKNIRAVLGDDETWFKYTPFAELLKNIRDITGRDFYKASHRMPELEYLAKLGFYKLAEESINGIKRMSGNNSIAELKIKKPEIPVIRKYNMGARELRIYRLLKDKSQYGYIDSLLRSKWDFYGITEIIKLCGEYKIQLAAAVGYIEEQCKSDKYYYRHHLISDWRDYLENCVRLGWNMKDTKVIRPKNLNDRHDIVAGLVRLEKVGGAERITEQYYSHVYDFAYDNGEYTVMLPRDIADLKYEGDNMHHCVYTNYAEKVAKGESIILFIRKNDKLYKPLATAEVNPKTYNVVQIRGYRNSIVDADIKKFWNTYTQNILGKLKKEAA